MARPRPQAGCQPSEGAISVAIFNTTYAAQSRVDAQLSNGADVTVTFDPAVNVSELAVFQSESGVVI